MLNRILFLFIILFIFGCSSPRYILNKDQVSFSDLLKGIEKEQNQIKTVIGESRISIETEEYSGNFFASILFNQNDSLLISVSGPFGIGVGKMFLGKNRFIFLNQFANQFYSGESEKFKNKNFMQFPLKIHEISNLFTGKEDIKNMKILDYDINNHLFYIHSKDNNYSYNIWIDNITGRIKKIEYLQEEQIILVKEYEKFVKFGNTYFPKHIKLTRPLENQLVSVYYNRIAINQEIQPSEFIINITDNARQIDLNLIESEVQETL